MTSGTYDGSGPVLIASMYTDAPIIAATDATTVTVRTLPCEVNKTIPAGMIGKSTKNKMTGMDPLLPRRKYRINER
jgi:hypothetical protein